MNKKIFILLIFVPFVLSWTMSQIQQNSYFSLSEASLGLKNRLTAIEKTKKGKRLLFKFLFPVNIDYEISYNEKERTAQIIFHQVDRHGFTDKMQIEESFFQEIHLSYSPNRSYRIQFKLLEQVHILPFSSQGNTANPTIGFIQTAATATRQTITLEEQLEQELERLNSKLEQLYSKSKLNPKTSLSLSHLSKQYNSQITDTSENKNLIVENSLIEQHIEPGVTAFRFRTANPLSEGHGFRIHRTVSRARLTATLAGGKLPGCLPLSDIMLENNAVVGINGSFYIHDGSPIGLFIHDHQVLSVPILLRSSFGIDQEGKAHIGLPEFQGQAVTTAGKIEISAINQNTDKLPTTIFTSQWTLPIRPQTNRTYISILQNKIVNLTTEPPDIGSSQYVLSVSNQLYPWVADLTINSPVCLSLELSAPWHNMRFALSGGPRLLANGSIADLNNEGFDKDFLTARAPRSAIGLDNKNNILLVVIDGRQEHSIGLTLRELSRCLSELGARDAINLDGGASSTLAHAGEIINKPSGGKQRPIANALMLLSR